ncbi:MAG: oligosaccharide flippase family protein [Thaumarchaeota archaeon]|nr:oligosaccharide flippase family protein [Nitrososphaerota archaeon]
MTESEDEILARGLTLGKVAAEGAVALLSTKLASRAIALVCTIVLIRLIHTPGNYALLGIATTVPGLVMIGDLSGVNASLTRYLSEYKAKGNVSGIWSSYWTAMSVKIFTGVALSLVAFALADPIAVLVGKPVVAPFLRVASPLPLVWTTQVMFKSTLLSLDRSRTYAVLQFLNEVLLSFSPIVAVVLGYGVLGAVIAMVIGNYLYFIIGMGLCTSAVVRESKGGSRAFRYFDVLRGLVRFGFALGFSNSISSSAGQVVNLIVARFVSLNLYGLYSVATSASAVVGYVDYPISTIDFTIFSRLQGLEDRALLQKVYRQVVRYDSAFVLPATLFVLIFAQPLVVLLFGSTYASAGILVSLLMITWFAYATGSSMTSDLVSSQGYTAIVGVLTIVNSAIGIIVAAVTLPTVGLQGYIVASAFMFVPAFIVLLRRMNSSLQIHAPFSELKPLFYALPLSAAVLLPISLLHLTAPIELILGASATCITYPVFLALFRGVNVADTKHMRAMLSAQPAVAKLMEPIVRLLERIIVAVSGRTRAKDD